ncbi:response regulator transcription factor [Shewanella colwelliana]|uniref:response regulator transcription factor n=1 Tax=Shewanella colwelliana TaxID=23 RepID=UPI0022B04A7B|nr:response regulator transcription factor [Shewanella colwelliana]MCZ4338118.1 response regulator transcription factor [Shewanella colwelliana]
MCKVLVVDDELVSREMLANSLLSLGYIVHCVDDGLQALEALNQYTFDLILLDIDMPKLDGFGFLKTRTNKLPVILVSSKNSEDRRVKGYELGADDFLSKPFSIRELSARMTALIRRIDIVKTNDETTNRLKVGEIDFNEVDTCIMVGHRKLKLTQTEFDLFRYLFDRKGEVVTKQELQRSVLNKELGQYDRNLDMHISNTRRKLAETELPKSLINTIRGQGYSFSA